MTGSYFRGDNVPILTPEDENNFEKITYTYYEQLNGYTYLKSLGIGYHFYTGSREQREKKGEKSAGNGDFRRAMLKRTRPETAPTQGERAKKIPTG
jgi:hypothetical protein